MQNCWTCTHDIPPPCSSEGHACARLDEDPEPRDVRAWVERTPLDLASQMPVRDAGACPGWAEGSGRADRVLPPARAPRLSPLPRS